jgi:cardiolipin synthase (CMP-forming)
MLAYLPNSLTVLRLLLAFPLGLLIMREQYVWALGVGFLAGLSDALDGYLARRLGVLSRIGAALDPIADKILITVSFVSLALVELIPWYLAIAVILRDVVIVAGAACYHLFIGPFEFAASRLSKGNMFIQISFCVLILLSQVVPGIPAVATRAGAVAVLVFAVASGFDYVMSWTAKAVQARKTTG